ncbi:MAG TPA: CHASE2 domain-containing protein, partial [Gammaproteobacteria bacterium]
MKRSWTRTQFWKSDWFVGLVVSLLLVLASGSSLMQGAERIAYDWGVRLSDASPSDRVAVITIDDQSIANLGRWPWSRDLHAAMIDLLKRGGAKVIGYTVFFLEPQLDPGLRYLRDIIAFYDASDLPQLPEFIPDPGNRQRLVEQLSELEGRIFEAEGALDTDRILAGSLEQAGNVVLAMPFVIGAPQGEPDTRLPDYVTRHALTRIGGDLASLGPDLLPLPTYAAIPPIPAVGPLALAIGHLNAYPDVDGSIRSEPLVLNHYDTLYPSVSLLLAARSLNLGNDKIEVLLGEGVRLGRLLVTTSPDLQMNTFFYGGSEGRSPFPVDSFYDVATGKIPPEKYKGKIVLVGATAVGIGDTQVTPISPTMAPVLSLAHSVSSILEEDFFVQPSWAPWLRLGLMLLVAAYLVAALPRFKAGPAAGISVALVALMLGAHVGLMTTQGIWIQFIAPLSMLVAGHLLLTTKRFLATERGKLRADAESADSNRMLGLSFQGQGQLDLAFEKFRK